MAIIFLVAITALLPLYLGMLYNKLLDKKENDGLITYLVGVFLLFGVFEILCVVGIKLDFTLERLTVLYSGAISIMLLLSLLVCAKEMSRLLGSLHPMFRMRRDAILITILFGLLCAGFWVYDSYGYYDTMIETTRTTLETGTLYQVNPLTGVEMVNGMYPMNQLYTLPIFYAVLAKLSGAEAGMLIDGFIPVWILLVHLLIVAGFGKKAGLKKHFICYYSGLLLFSKNLAHSEGFALLHQGYHGNTIILAVLIPGAVLLLYHAWKHKSNLFAKLFVAGIAGASGLMLLYLPGAKKLLQPSFIYLLLAMVYTVLTKREMNRKQWFGYVSLGILACLSNASFALGAYVLSDVYERYKASAKKWIVCVATWVIVILQGGVLLYPAGDAVHRAETGKEAELEVIAYIEKMNRESGQVILAAPRPVMQEVRKATGKIVLPYGRNYWEDSLNKEVGDIYDDEAYSLYSALVEMEVATQKAEELANKQGTVPMPIEEMIFKGVSNRALDKGCTVLVTLGEMPDSVKDWTLLQEINGYYIYAVL